MREHGQNLRPFGQIVEDALMILGMQRSLMVPHVKQEANTAAHCLAKTTISCIIERIWVEELLSCIHDTVILEQSAL
jgi:hypothetical protein